MVAEAGFSAVKLPLVPGSVVQRVPGEAFVRSGCASPTADLRRLVGWLLRVRLVVECCQWILLLCCVLLVGCLDRLGASVRRYVRAS